MKQEYIEQQTIGGLSMDKTIRIKNEAETDHARVEEITKKAFYNLYIPGCVEHYLVHVMHRDDGKRTAAGSFGREEMGLL